MISIYLLSISNLLFSLSLPFFSLPNKGKEKDIGPGSFTGKMRGLEQFK